MGTIKQLIIMHRDLNGPDEPLPPLDELRREHARYLKMVGNRVGLTDEQMAEVRDDKD